MIRGFGLFWAAAGLLSAMLVVSGPARAAEPVPGQLPADRVMAFEQPGTVWCFEPEGRTCSFITLTTEPVKHNPRYDVLQLLDAGTVLTVHTGGVLRRDGRICERGTGFIDSLQVTSRFGVPLSPARQTEVRDRLRQVSRGTEAVEYCYAYAVDRGGGPGRYIRYQFADGEEDGDPLPLLIDSAPDAAAKYRLRLPR